MSDYDDCNSSFDCSTDGIARFCFSQASFSNETFFCDCSVYFGWTGEQCDQPSSSQGFYKTSGILILIWSLILMILTSRTVILNLILGRNPTKHIDPLLFTALFVFLASSCLFAVSVLTLPSFFLSERFEPIEYRQIFLDDTFDVGVKNGYAANSFTLFSVMFQAFATLNMIISLDKTVNKLSRFNPFVNKKKIITRNRVLFFSCCGIFLVMVILTVTEYSFVGNLLLSLIIFITSGYYIYSVVNFVRFVNSLSATEDKTVKLTTELVKKVCVHSSIAIIIIAITTVIYAFTLATLDKRLAPGDFNYVLSFRDIGVFAGLYLFSVIAWYVNSVTEGAVLADGYQYICCIFKLWDNKNVQLMPD